jgi:NhaP-type Na+/H+ or K+/H+ antiporter
VVGRTTRRAFPWIRLALPPSLAGRNEIVIAAFGVVAISVVLEGLTMPLLLILGFLPKRR